jgi:hypothetical protein
MTNPRLSALLSSSAKRLGLAACVSALALGGISAAQAQDGSPMQIPDYRGSLRTMIAELSGYAKGRNPDFLIITREGIGLTVKEKREADVERLLHPAVNGART